MRYVGGKARIAKWVSGNILKVAPNRLHYLEPFVGSAVVFKRVAPHFQTATAGDISKDLMLLWKAIGEGWQPPISMTREEWERLRKAEPSALRAFAGHAASYRGKWFSSFATLQVGFLQVDSIIGGSEVLKAAKLICCDYRSFRPDKSFTVYCDPPYADTMEVGMLNKFDSYMFWRMMDEWVANGATVIVSEISAPSDWPILAETEVRVSFHEGIAVKGKTRTERLFWKSGVSLGLGDK